MSQLIEVISHIPIEGNVLNHNNVSGVSHWNDTITIGSDEGSQIQILIHHNHKYKVIDPAVDLMASGDGDEIEVDIEAITHDESGVCYVLGSHSAKRKKVKKSKSYKANRKRIQMVSQEKLRGNLFRMRFDASGMPVKDIASTNLDTIFEQDKILSMFNNIPSKENGIDLEGMASRNGQLFLGFRGPVLRENFVPVLVTTFDNTENYEMRFVNLNGKGIRDMVAVNNGFLIVAGPVSEGDGRFHLHFWNGEDEIPGKERPVSPNSYIGEIPIPHEGAKAEGITILEESEEYYTAIIIFDGVELKQFPVFKINKQY